MFNRRSTNEVGLEAAIDAVLASMQAVPKDTPEYAKMLENLETLYKIKEKEVTPRDRVSPNTVLLVAGNIVGILAIVGYEYGHVMTSKALNFLKSIPVKKS